MVGTRARPQRSYSSVYRAPVTAQNTLGANGSFTKSLSGPSSSIGSAIWQAPSHWNVGSSTAPQQPTVSYKKPPKVKKRTPEELEITKQKAARVASRLALDQPAVLNPDVDTPFTDHLDVVNRLLPYHVFQQPKEDLEYLLSGKGKGKGKGRQLDLQEEVQETTFALECYRRRQAIHKRMRNLKIRSGKRLAPDDQAYVLAQSVLETERNETAQISIELRTARADLERIERDKRMASGNMGRVTQYPSATPATMPQYYRPYPYPYTQVYGAPMATGSTSTFQASPPPLPLTGYTPYQSAGAIPVQLPVASLPALHALGIMPVPASSLPPEGQPQPAAVLRGSTANGTMLSLEINVSLLQSAQMSGLAMVLNSLMARSGQVQAEAMGNSATPTETLAKGS